MSKGHINKNMLKSTLFLLSTVSFSVIKKKFPNINENLIVKNKSVSPQPMKGLGFSTL